MNRAVRRRWMVAGGALFTSAALLGTACSFPGISYRDGDNAATIGPEAQAGDGVAPSDGGIRDVREAAPLVDALAACPALCEEAGIGVCDAGTCGIVCTAADTCLDPIACPARIPCAITCTGAGSCASTVDCAGSGAHAHH
ncbi:MAG: hypothetical protein HOO96_27885, partial [Polyangiaceae bacterium]|nr:hypothetical protein [Polyangiaceae bacterium]